MNVMFLSTHIVIIQQVLLNVFKRKHNYYKTNYFNQS